MHQRSVDNLSGSLVGRIAVVRASSLSLCCLLVASGKSVRLAQSPCPFPRTLLNGCLINMTTKPAERVSPFHLAIEVENLAESRRFYGQLFGCPEGRSSDCWVDFDFFGHQLVCHVSENYPARMRGTSNPVDGHNVPVPHFGVVLPIDVWHALASKLKASGTQFVIAPYTRFEGQPGEQSTMFLLDPSGNALEFKAFKDIGQLFAT